jgi:hypothetical protein
MIREKKATVQRGAGEAVPSWGVVGLLSFILSAAPGEKITANSEQREHDRGVVAWLLKQSLRSDRLVGLCENGISFSISIVMTGLWQTGLPSSHT